MKELDIAHIRYASFSSEEFLQDDFFVSSMAKPTKETESFWLEFERSNPQNISEYTTAKNYINEISDERNKLSDNEISDLWKSIETDTIAKKRQRRRIGWWMRGAAAAVFLLIGIGSYLHFAGTDNGEDILSFAQQTKGILSNTNDALLILSKDKIMRMKQKESRISYDSTSVKVGKSSVADNQLAAFNQLIIPRGKRSMLTLSDGSKVWINSGSRLIYPVKFKKDKREIYVDGEIYIEVTKDASRPFYVRTRDMNVRVLGTKFNVTAYESEKSQQVVLVEGRVQVASDSHGNAVLHPNQLYYSHAGETYIKRVDVSAYISWVDGIFCFDGEDLGTVFNRLSTYYAVNVKYDAKIRKLKGSGKIDLNDNFENVLRGLAFVIPISYQYNATTRTFIIEKKE